MPVESIESSVDTRRHASTIAFTNGDRIDGALPIVVGVTGHRVLEPAAIARLERVVAELFAQLRRAYPSSPLVVLSPLAEGADRLVARVGLAVGAKLIVPLPFDCDHYRRDFVASDSQREFDELIARAHQHFVLPLMEGHAANATSAPGHARDMHYAQVGAYVARVGQIIIALWDGDTTNLRGGTSDVVTYRLHGAPPDFVPGGGMLDAPLSGPLYHVVTPSPKTPAPAYEPFTVRTLYPSGYASDAVAAEAFAAKLRSVDRFNEDERRLRKRLNDARDRSRAQIMPAAASLALDIEARRLAEHFAAADALALHYAKRSFVALVSLIAGVVVAVLFFEIYGHLFPRAHWLLGAYLAAMAVAWCVQRIARYGEYHSKHLDYRALAEGLRVQFFWRVAGLYDNVADHYMRKQRSVLDWIRDAIRTWSIGVEVNDAFDPDSEAALDAEAVDERFAIVIEMWVGDQSRYFARSARRLHRRLHIMERISDTLFGAAMVLAFGLIVGHTAFGDRFVPGHVPVFSIGVCVLIAGVLHGFISKRAYPELSKQFQRMAGVFEYAHRILVARQASGDHTNSRLLIKELGIEALGENGDWLVLHRERPVEMPKGH